MFMCVWISVILRFHYSSHCSYGWRPWCFISIKCNMPSAWFKQHVWRESHAEIRQGENSRNQVCETVKRQQEAVTQQLLVFCLTEQTRLGLAQVSSDWDTLLRGNVPSSISALAKQCNLKSTRLFMTRFQGKEALYLSPNLCCFNLSWSLEMKN